MGQFADYHVAIASVALFALFTQLLGPIAAVVKSKDGIVAGAQPTPDYGSRTYRLWRSHINATEMLGVFIAAVGVAILAAVSPWWVNILALVFLLSRLIQAAIHIAGIGAENTGPRTMLFTVGWLSCGALSLMALYNIFAGATVA